MRKLFLILLSISCLMYAQDTLTILHVNDTHSMLAPMAPRMPDLKGTQGGIARAATVIGLTKMTEPNVLTVHGGDAFIGDLFFNQYFGVAEFRLMNAIGFDVMALGNHEFDLTPSTLLAAFDSSIAGGGFSVVSSNLNLEDPGVQPLKKYVKPYTIKQFGNIKVGIFSLLTPETNLLSQPSPAVVEEDVISTTTNMVTTLLGEGCNFIICLSHMGINYDKLIAGGAPFINVIISAHDHLITNTPVEITNPLGKPVWIVQANSAYSHIGKLKIVVKDGDANLIDYKLIPLDQTIPEEKTIAGIVDTLIAGIEAVYGPLYTQQCAVATDFFEEVTTDLYSPGIHDTPIGNLVTDAFRWKTGTDVAITVGGATIQPVYAGPVVPADLFRVLGYGFNTVNGLGYRIVKIKMSGASLWAAIESTVSVSEIILNDEFLPQVSGMKYFCDSNNPPGARIVWITINNQPLDPLATYTVTTDESLVYAMEKLFSIPYSDPYVYQDSTEFQVLLDYVVNENGGIISPYVEGRVTLPVELTFFNVIKEGNKILLTWQVASETNNKGFEIERRTNGTWGKIGYVNGNGTSSEYHFFSYSDNLDNLNSFGIICYRLKQINYDGSFDYSKEVSVNQAPYKYELSQNYPNPFNPTTNFEFQISNYGLVSLKVYDILGREVATIINEELPAGNYKYQWNASGLASGVYIYRLQAGSFIDTKKLILMK